MKISTRIKFVLLSLAIISCSSDEKLGEKTYLYKSDKVNFTEFIDNKMSSSDRTASEQDDYIHSEFETDFYIPENLTIEETEQFIINNQQLINGDLKFFINDNEFLSYTIENGQLQNNSKSYILSTRNPGDYPCSYDGIQDCTQAAIDNWHPITAVICSFGALACVYEEIAICISENCIEN